MAPIGQVTLGAIVALLVSVGVASAKPKVLYLEAAEKAVALGTLADVALGPISVETSDGATAECPDDNILEGEIRDTDEPADIIEIVRTYLQLRGPLSAPCGESVALDTVHKTYVGVSGFPFKIALRANGTASIAADIVITIYDGSYPFGEPSLEKLRICTYRGKPALQETINGPVSVKMSGVFNRARGVAKTCPKTLSVVDHGPAVLTDSPFGPSSGDLYFDVSGWVQ